MIIPILGIPIVWRDALVFISGLFLVLVSLGPVILRKLQIKPKQKKRQNKNDTQSPPTQANSVQEVPVQNDELRFSVEENNQTETEK
jgi:hypothetical protein